MGPDRGVTSTQNTEAKLLDLLLRDRLISNSAVSLQPLSGGVSSNVFLVKEGDKTFVVKQALERLRVSDVWLADTSRNRNEYEYLRYVGRILPGVVPQVFAVRDGYFTMEYVGNAFSNWKQLLLSGDCRASHAQLAARILGTIHHASFCDHVAENLFDTTKTFHQLRVHPYLLTSGERHPLLKEHFEAEAYRLENTRECLVHGDYSPKNVLVSDRQLILLDCEVAWYGDGAFDLAFLVSHLLLKSLYHAPQDMGLPDIIAALTAAYYGERKFSTAERARFDSRTSRLLVLLLLARIDGKSPVEYLSNETKREFVRRFAYVQLRSRNNGLRETINQWFASLEDQFVTRKV
jgi:aminoglycoside phosphotransferase (APT) family kinase protein